MGVRAQPGGPGASRPGGARCVALGVQVRPGGAWCGLGGPGAALGGPGTALGVWAWPWGAGRFSPWGFWAWPWGARCGLGGPGTALGGRVWPWGAGRSLGGLGVALEGRARPWGARCGLGGPGVALGDWVLPGLARIPEQTPVSHCVPGPLGDALPLCCVARPCGESRHAPLRRPARPGFRVRTAAGASAAGATPVSTATGRLGGQTASRVFALRELQTGTVRDTDAARRALWPELPAPCSVPGPRRSNSSGDGVSLASAQGLPSPPFPLAQC